MKKITQSVILNTFCQPTSSHLKFIALYIYFPFCHHKGTFFQSSKYYIFYLMFCYLIDTFRIARLWYLGGHADSCLGHCKCKEGKEKRSRVPVTLRSASPLQEPLAWQFVEPSHVCFDRTDHSLCDVSRPVGDEVFSYRLLMQIRADGRRAWGFRERKLVLFMLWLSALHKARKQIILCKENYSQSKSTSKGFSAHSGDNIFQCYREFQCLALPRPSPA